jgi:uncharacterized protein (TIGR03086 family)
MMQDVNERYVAALDEADHHVRSITPDQWTNATPCDSWDVRALLDHLVYETLWVPDLVAGSTLDEVGARYDGDRLGHDPKAAWTVAKDAATAGVRSAEPGVPVHTSSGELTADEYLTEMLFDATIHGWDLAQGVGVDHPIPGDVAADLLAWFATRAEAWIAAGAIAEPIQVDDDADAATKLIALSGRNPYSGAGQPGP